MDTPSLMNAKIFGGCLLTEQLQLPKITTVTSPGCLVMVAQIKATISYVIFGKTGYSVKHSGWGWPHMLRLHAGSCRCHNISAGWLAWRDGDILLPWGNNPVFFLSLEHAFLSFVLLVAKLCFFPPSSFFLSFFPFFAHFVLDVSRVAKEDPDAEEPAVSEAGWKQKASFNERMSSEIQVQKARHTRQAKETRNTGNTQENG